MAEPVRPQKKI